MADDLINLTIDDVPLSVPKGTLVIEAAKQAGVLVPHYCYHPGLPVAGLCRMCLVEIEKAPKLQIACATQVAEGMVVRTQSPQAKSGRMGVLELLLINHPLDCPSVTKQASASCRISRSRKVVPPRATAPTTPSASTRSRTSAPTCCTSRTAASCARAAS